jgi:hypothetical protein
MNVRSMVSGEDCGIAVTVNENRTTVTVRCLKCSRTWKPKILKGGRLESGWHRCNAGCSDGWMGNKPEFVFTDHMRRARRH